MYCRNLKYISSFNGLRPSDLARLAGVSRAAVSRWFCEGAKTGFVNVETRTLLRLSQNLCMPPEFFFADLPDLEAELALFLWDHLYPDMTAFVSALVKGEMQALARLVQVLGFHESKNIFGEKIIRNFPKYKKYLHPVRCKQFEAIWDCYKS